MIKIRFMFSGNFEVNNRVNAYSKGDVIDAPDNDAYELVIGLCAELVKDKLIEKPRKYVTKEADHDG